MNSLEASRVLAVLDESLEELRLLSYVTPEVMDSAEQLADVLGEELVASLVRHRTQTTAGKSNITSEQTIASTWSLIRMLRKSRATSRLQQLHTERSTGMLQALSYAERLRQYAQKRLTTTVEEDNSNREYYDEVREREEKAVNEKVQLEQKLKLQRVELQRQTHLVQSAEDKTRSELHEVQMATLAAKKSLQQEATALRGEDHDAFDTEHTLLFKELSDAKAQLETLRLEHKDNEATLRKTKKRAQQDVEVVISEYDTDVGSKEEEYQSSLSEYNEVMAQLEQFSSGFAEMHKERMEYEEAERKAAQQRLDEGLTKVRNNRAARVIQSSWKGWKAAKVAAAKKAKKGRSKERKLPGNKETSISQAGAG
eukprot:gene9805-7695_t